MKPRPYSISVLSTLSKVELVRRFTSADVQVLETKDLLAEAEQFRREWGELGNAEREQFWAKVIEDLQRE